MWHFNRTILCVDDHERLLAIRRLVLEGAVLTACDGDFGLQLFRDNHIDLVITDYLLPGVTGAQIASAGIRPNLMSSANNSMP